MHAHEWDASGCAWMYCRYMYCQYMDVLPVHGCVWVGALACMSVRGGLNSYGSMRVYSFMSFYLCFIFEWVTDSAEESLSVCFSSRAENACTQICTTCMWT